MKHKRMPVSDVVATSPRQTGAGFFPSHEIPISFVDSDSEGNCREGVGTATIGTGYRTWDLQLLCGHKKRLRIWEGDPVPTKARCADCRDKQEAKRPNGH
jgi:hypothetical protein